MLSRVSVIVAAQSLRDVFGPAFHFSSEALNHWLCKERRIYISHPVKDYLKLLARLTLVIFVLRYSAILWSASRTTRFRHLAYISLAI